MRREDQNGRNAPNRGSMIRQSTRGIASFDVPAITSFPSPGFLTDTQRQIWTAALSDVPLEFFRARHIPIMIQYVRAVERMMKYSDEFEADSEDLVALGMWTRMLKIVQSIERQLSFGTIVLIARTDRARGEQRVVNQTKRAQEAAKSDNNPRSGLVYVGY